MSEKEVATFTLKKLDKIEHIIGVDNPYELFRVNGCWWQILDRVDHDPFGFSIIHDQNGYPPDVLKVTICWYNGGAYHTEVLEEVIKEMESK